MVEYSNNMSRLLNKIERRLGLIPLEEALDKAGFGKDTWADVIKEDTIPTYSRFVPKVISFKISKNTAPKKNGWYYIDEAYLGNQKIVGVGDIDWAMFNSRSMGLTQTFGYGVADAGVAAGLTIDDMYNMSAYATLASLESNQLIPEFRPPNMLRLVAVGNNDVNIGDFNIKIFVEQDDSLTSIPASAMEHFEDLAIADVATYLLNVRFWDGLETPLATINLQMDRVSDEANKRDAAVEYLEQNYVSANNKAIPILMCI